ncbi:hypothetical protein SHLO109777_06330 [Shewanella loihica]|nr:MULTISPECIES: hypothetical protein [Shewanella]QYJ91026.1 hypothetical protein K0H81_05395 [Shewanella halotolerans]QYJ96751.1 hypothetical protein K0J45_14615 [Shewanella alkalitolerans]TVP11538.1 hypothetical protein AYI87_16500 [Shewanella sp. KCT]
MKNNMVNKALVSLSLLVGLMSVGAQAASSITLNDEFDYRGQKVALDMDVGQAELIAGDQDKVRVEVVVKANDSKWFGFWQNSDVSSAKFDILDDGDKLVLRLADQDDVNQKWRVYLPRNAALKVDAGVGEVIVDGLSASIEVELGVGRAEITHQASFGDVSLESGVGEVSIRDGGQRLKVNQNLVSQSYHQQGTAGDDHLYVSVGVGEIDVRN